MTTTLPATYAMSDSDLWDLLETIYNETLTLDSLDSRDDKQHAADKRAYLDVVDELVARDLIVLPGAQR